MRSKQIPADRINTAVALRVNDAAQFLGIGRSKIYALIKQGKLVSYRPAGRTTLLRSDLETFAKGEQDSGLTQVNP